MALSASQEAWRLLHPKMALSVASILLAGHFLSPYPLNVERCVVGVVGVIVALTGSYRLNEAMDFVRGSTSRKYHIWMGSVLVALGSLMGIYLSIRYVWWILILLVVGAGGMLAYNLLRTPMVHNRVTYSVVWGAAPFLCSYFLQTLNPIPPLYIIAWAVFFSLVAVEILWTWGPAGCRYQAECTRARPDKVCHSPVMTCFDRLNVPKAIRQHTKAMVSMKVVGMMLLAIAVFLMRWA